MAIDKKTLVKKLLEIANDIDEEDRNLRGAKCALLVICGVVESEVPEHMMMLHNTCYDLAYVLKQDLEERLRLEKQKELVSLLN